MVRRHPEKAVRGVVAPRPRPTGWALIYFLLYIALPVMLIMLLLDGVGYLYATKVLGTCYGLLCWL